MKLDLLVKLKYESSTIILFVGNRYSVYVAYFLTSIIICLTRNIAMCVSQIR